MAAFHMVTADREAIREAQEILVPIIEKGKTMDIHKDVKFIILRDIVLLGYGTLVAKHCVDEKDCPVNLVKVCSI